MTLLKQFMDWVTVSRTPPSQEFFYLRRRLLVAYVMVMATILGISGTAMYIFFSRSLNQHLDHRLLTLGQAAVPSLSTVKTKGRHDLDRDIPWRALFSDRDQTLEWFGVNGELLAREGYVFPQSPLMKNSSIDRSSPIFQQEDRIRSVTIAVYTDEVEKDILKLKGYIRASESLDRKNSTLNQLQLGLWLGGTTALFFICVSSVYLTHQAFKPTLKSFQQLKQFAADASHELGGPLTKIGFATEMLLSNPEQLKKSSAINKITIIRNAGEQMQSLLEDLLFLARTDSASPLTKPEKSTIFLDELLEQLVEHFAALAQNKAIDFQTDLHNGLKIKGDAAQLNRLFSNLLSNAFKYTDRKGKILLSLKAYKHSAVVSVRDTGIGISPKYLPYVFERFWRSERARKQEGLGLGLAIAKTIAQQHGGKITVSSEVNVGTCFTVYLPSI